MNKDEGKCLMCGGEPDKGMLERIANGDIELCDPCYRFEYFGEVE
jgi:ribosome-binding protein aMBF1 (putative translation factor)